MKDWSELTLDMTVYFMDPLEIMNDNEQVIATIPPLQEYRVFTVDKDEYGLYVVGGTHAGEEFFFHPNDDNIERLLSETEYKALKNTEAAVWPKLKKFIKEIEALPEISADMESLLLLLKAHSGGKK